MSTAWPAEHTDELRKLHRDGLSCSQAAKALNKKFGTALSRNSVIGKLNRLGIEWAPPSTPSRVGRATPVKPRQAAPSKPKDRGPLKVGKNGVRPKPSKQAASMRAILGPGHSPTIKAPTPYVERIEPAGKVTMLELGAHHCRWPVGDPSSDGFRFCGDDKPLDGSYCPRHAKVAYEPSRPRPPSTEPNTGRRRAA